MIRPWKPVLPPKRGEDRTEFHAFMLLPGLSLSFYAAALGRSRSSVSAYRAAANDAARMNPVIMASVRGMIGKLSHEDGLQMAKLRGRAQLPHWSRLAISEFAKRGYARSEIAKAFACSIGTVASVLQGIGRGYGALSGERRLTASQLYPVGRWAPGRPRLIRNS